MAVEVEKKVRHYGGITILVLSRKRDGISTPRFYGICNRLKVRNPQHPSRSSRMFSKFGFKKTFKKKTFEAVQETCALQCSNGQGSFQSSQDAKNRGRVFRIFIPIPQQGSHVNPPII